jgi:hypothetical protein
LPEDGLRGVTSNPSIFKKAIAEGAEYGGAIQELQQEQRLEPMALYEALAIRDIRAVASYTGRSAASVTSLRYPVTFRSFLTLLKAGTEDDPAVALAASPSMR